MEFTEKHKRMLDSTGKTFAEIKAMSAEEIDTFITDKLLPFVCGSGTKDEEEIAEDIITMITVK